MRVCVCICACVCVCVWGDVCVIVRVGLFVRMCLYFAYVCASVCVCAFRLCVWLCVFGLGFIRACLSFECVREYMRGFVSVCMHMCIPTCVRVCECEYVCENVCVCIRVRGFVCVCVFV